MSKNLDELKYEELLDHLKDEEDADLAFLRWKAITDLYYLGTKIMDWKTIKEGGRIDPRFHQWLCRVIGIEEDKMIIVFREAMKSTWTKLRIIQKILADPNYCEILLISKTAGLVELELKSIKIMLCNPKLRALFPDVIPEPGKDFINWEKSTHDELTLKRDYNQIYVPQQPQVFVCGAEATITGRRFTDCYLDDVIDDDSVTTAEKIEKIDSWWSYMMPILGDAPITIIGTPYHYADLYHKIIKRGEFGKYIYKRAIKEGGKFVYSFFNEKRLKKRTRGMDPYAISCQFFCDSTPREAKIFPPPQPVCANLSPGKYKFYMAIDPAATTKSYSDKTGISIAAVDESGYLSFVESFGVKLPPDKLCELIIKKHLQYRTVRVGIELGLQESLRYLLDVKVRQYERQNERIGLTIMPIPVSRTRNKASRISYSLGAFVRDGRCKIVERNCKELITQMDMYTGKGSDDDDVIDSASMIFSCVETFAQHYWYQPSFRNYPGMSLFDIFKPEVPAWEDKFVSGRTA